MDTGTMSNEDDAGLLQPKRPVIAQTLHRLWKHPDKTCTSAEILRSLPGHTTQGTVYEAIDAFEEQGWVERGELTGRTRPLHVTDRGDTVFSKLGDFLDAINYDHVPGGS